MTGNLLAFRKNSTAVKYLRIQSNCDPPGPWPIKDYVNFTCALFMIRSYQLTERNKKGNQQLETIKNSRTLYSNVIESSSRESGLLVTYRDPEGELISFLALLHNRVSLQYFQIAY